MLRANPLTAALGGAWSALGIVPYHQWVVAIRSEPHVINIFFDLAIYTLFMLVPAYLLVIGHHVFVPADDERNPSDWIRYSGALGRGFVWLVAVGSVGPLVAYAIPHGSL
jgi:hypothetical protein